MSSATALWVSVCAGLLIVLAAVGIPYWLTHRHMRPAHDPGEKQAYFDATGRDAEDVAAGRPGQHVHPGKPAARRWQASALERVQETDESVRS